MMIFAYGDRTDSDLWPSVSKISSKWAAWSGSTFFAYRFSNMDCSKLKCSLQTSQNELWFSHFCHTLYLEVHPKHTKVMFCFLLKQIFVYIFLLKQSVMTWEIQTIFHCTFLFHCLIVYLVYLESTFCTFVSFCYWQCITN